MTKYVTNEEFDKLASSIKWKLNGQQEQINEISNKITKQNDQNEMKLTIKKRAMDKYKYRLTQKTIWGEIDHYFHEDREEQLIKLIRYCNENKIDYELNKKAKEFHNKLYNMILKGE